MSSIELSEIIKHNNTIEYIFKYSGSLAKYFTGKKFLIEYPENIEVVPDEVLAIPFVAGVLPICWLTDSKLYIKDLDRDFYNSIPEFKNGFINMYPEANFKGELVVDHIIECRPIKQCASAVFFSGGIDATTTLLRHIDENSFLITLWGADVEFDNTEGWNTVEKGIHETANQYGLNLLVVRTMFRQFDDVMNLTADFKSVLYTSWWYGIKHGIGIISHAAPLAWLHGFSRVYIASSNCPDDGVQQCASDPTIDNCVAYCGCKTIHDGFELDRQKKTDYIIEYHMKNPDTKLLIRACWKSKEGTNCCQCEKCYRTMAGFWVAGADPKEYGFDYPADVFKKMYKQIALHGNDLPAFTWTRIGKRLNENWEDKRIISYREKIEWMRNYDFFNPENNECRKNYDNSWKLKSKIVKLFPHMYKLYVKLRGYSFD